MPRRVSPEETYTACFSCMNTRKHDTLNGDVRELQNECSRLQKRMDKSS